MEKLQLIPATLNHLSLLRHWDEQPHVIASDPNDDWEWETELAHNPPWREQLIAEWEGKPIGFVQIIDPLSSNTRAHRFYERLGFALLGPKQFGEDSCLVYRLGRHTWTNQTSN